MVGSLMHGHKLYVVSFTVVGYGCMAFEVLYMMAIVCVCFDIVIVVLSRL